MSTFHDSVEVEPEEISMGKSKPNTILDYNQNKLGVDSVDQMRRIYSVKELDGFNLKSFKVNQQASALIYC